MRTIKVPSLLRASRPLSLVGAAIVGFVCSPALAQGTGGAAENWARIAACARLDKPDERLACADEVYRAAGLRDRAPEGAQQRETFGEPKREKAMPAASPAPSAHKEAPTRPAPAPPLESITTTISKAFDPGNHLLVIVAQDGQIWQQNESKDLGLPPLGGTVFTVEKGALGSFTCRIAKGRSFRCRRHS